MRIVSYAALVLGLALAVVLVVWQGVGTVVEALLALGAGVLLLVPVYLPHIFGSAASWRLVFPPERRPAYAVLLRAIWIGHSVEMLLPGAALGAEAAKIRVALAAGVAARDTVAAMLADVTVQGMVIALWAGIAVAVLATLQAGTPVLHAALVGAALLGAAMCGFLAAQRAGLLRRLAGIAHRAARGERWRGLAVKLGRLDAALQAIYDAPGRVALATLIRLASRSMLIVEVWLAAALMGRAMAPLEAVALVGIVNALRAATVVVPGGWGVQEGGFIVIGGLLGLPAEVALAISLATRAREVMVGVPALIVWQIAESRALTRIAGRE